MRRPHLWLLLAIAVTLLSGCTQRPEDTVRIGIHVWPGYDTLILARDKGYLNDANVKLIETPSATESIRAFQNQSVDGALLTLDEVLRLADHGHDPVVILVMDFSNGADALLSRPGITELSALKGKSIGVEPNALGAYMLARALDSEGLTAADVTTVSMPIVETETAFVEQLVDAVVTYDPHRTRILKQGAVQLFDSSQIPGEITDVLVVRRAVLENSPKALQRLVDAQFKALDFLARSPEPAITLMAKREKLTNDDFRALLGQLELADIAANRRLLSRSDNIFPRAIRQLNNIMQEHKILGQDLSGLEVRDDRFVKASSL